MAAYLQNYADHFQLPVHTGVRVQDVTPGFAVTTSAGRLTARYVVVATGPFHDPVIPAAAGDLDPSVPQRHAYAYRGPADIPTDEVTIVGGGNSAAQIALELTASHRVTLVAPREPWFVPAQGLGLSSYRWMSWLGILDADVELRRGELVLRTSRVVGAAGRTLTLADGSTVPAPAVVWCTGFHARYDWLRVPGSLDAGGNPVHHRGASLVTGLHWMGLPWQETLSSSIIHGAGGDARRCAERVIAAG